MIPQIIIRVAAVAVATIATTMIIDRINKKASNIEITKSRKFEIPSPVIIDVKPEDFAVIQDDEEV